MIHLVAHILDTMLKKMEETNVGMCGHGLSRDSDSLLALVKVTQRHLTNIRQKECPA